MIYIGRDKMDSPFANIPSPIASSTPIHEVEYEDVSSNRRNWNLDWGLDMIEHNYMCIIEEKERIILQLMKCISQKDHIIEQLQAINERNQARGLQSIILRDNSS